MSQIHCDVAGNKVFEELPATSTLATTFLYALEVYVDDFMSIVIPTSWEQLEHVATVVTTGIHDDFLADVVASNNSISEKKLLKGEGQYSLFKHSWVSILTDSKRQCG